MKIKNILTDVLKDFMSGKCKLFYGKYNDDYFVSDGYHGYLIPPDVFPFDIVRISEIEKRQLFSEDSVKVIMEGSRYSKKPVPGMLTGEMKSSEDGKKLTLCRLTDTETKEMTVWVNQKYLKNFENPEFTITSDIGPIFVYEEGKKVGVILPVKLRDRTAE